MSPVNPRWLEEGGKHWRAGDHSWMAGLLDGRRRVLEIGCGAGFSTLALARAGHQVLVVEPDAACRAAAQERMSSEAPGLPVRWLGAALGALDPEARESISAFAPEIICCWMMGVADSELDASLPQHQAVGKALATIQRAVAELAAELPSVTDVHLVDRTAFPWKIKDTARETLAMIHATRTFAGLPFNCKRENALYRKLDPMTWPDGMQRGAGGIVPVLGSLLVRRSSPT